MNESIRTENPELDALFERYRAAPTSHVFAPLADACRKAGLLDEAIEICDRGVRENPGYTSGHVVRGKCYYDRGDVALAEASFETVLSLDSNNLVALKFLGAILAGRGNESGAREHFKHILALDPDDREIRALLEEISEEPRRGAATTRVRDDAIEDAVPARPVLSVPDGDGDDDVFEGPAIELGDAQTIASDELATMTLADIYSAQGYFDRALRIYREVQRRQPNNDGVARRIAEAESKLGRKREPAAPVSAPLPGVKSLKELNAFSPAPEQKAEEPSFREIEERATAVPAGMGRPHAVHAAAENVDDGDPRVAIDEGRSYEQFKRWLKNVAE